MTRHKLPTLIDNSSSERDNFCARSDAVELAAAECYVSFLSAIHADSEVMELESLLLLPDHREDRKRF